MLGAGLEVACGLSCEKVSGAFAGFWRACWGLIKLSQATVHQIYSSHQSHVCCYCHQIHNLVCAAQHFQLIPAGCLAIYHFRASTSQSRVQGSLELGFQNPGMLCPHGFYSSPAAVWWELLLVYLHFIESVKKINPWLQKISKNEDL